MRMVPGGASCPEFIATYEYEGFPSQCAAVYCKILQDDAY